MPTESNSFEIILKALMDDFGGPEIFSEENEPRLTKALKSIEGLFAKEKKQLLMACMENVPQTMYSAVGLPPKEQQAKVDVCLEKLDDLGVAKSVAESILLGFIAVLKLNAKATKTPEFEKIMGEMEIDGEIYKTCQIGKQIWMAENLRVSHYGRKCLAAGESLGKAVPGYKYGRLYTRYDAEYYNENGWHLPSIEDWLEMVQYIESLGFDAGTALKSVGDWGGKADPGLDLFGFAAHPIKFWDDNWPQKMRTVEEETTKFFSELKSKDCFKGFDIDSEIQKILKKDKESPFADVLNRYAGETEIGNRYLDMSIVSQFPCVQFWTSTKYVDNPRVDYADNMAYVATLGDFNKVDLDGAKLSCSGRTYSPYVPFGFACVRYVKDAER